MQNEFRDGIAVDTSAVKICILSPYKATNAASVS